MPVKEKTQICCKEPDCSTTFPSNPFSSIQEKRCPNCRYKLKYAKQVKYAENSRTRQKQTNSTKAVKDKKKRKPQKWENKPTAILINYVQFKIVNPYIRARDNALYSGKCISCQHEHVQEAGHRFPISSYPGMRFLVNNIHGQGTHCNCDLYGNLKEYDCGLIRRFGVKYLKELHETAQLYQQGHLKLLRHEIIEIGRTYKHLHDNRIWVLHQKAFDTYKNIINGNI